MLLTARLVMETVELIVGRVMLAVVLLVIRAALMRLHLLQHMVSLWQEALKQWTAVPLKVPLLLLTSF